MKYLIAYLCVFLVGSSVFAEVNTKTSLRYSCQIGEKPGVPQYSLEIQDRSFIVRKSIPLLSTTVIEAKGDLADEDFKSLQQILKKISPNVDSKVEELAGAFSMEMTIEGKTKSYKGTSAKRLPSLEPLAKWIQSFHKKYPGLGNLAPLIPGDSEKMAY